MTKNTSKRSEEMQPEELLAVIEKKMRSPRTKTADLLRLQAKRAKLLKQMGRNEPPRAPQSISEFTKPQQRVLRGDSLLGTLSDEDRTMWESIYRSENEKSAKRQAKPADESQAPPAGMTVADAERYLRSQHQGGSVTAKAVPAQPKIEADVN